jgi:hypothetical protein
MYRCLSQWFHCYLMPIPCWALFWSHYMWLVPVLALSSSSCPLGPRCGNKIWPETEAPTCLPCPLSMCVGSLSSQWQVDNGGSRDGQYAQLWSQPQPSWMLPFVSSHHLNEVAGGVWPREGHVIHWSYIAHYSVAMTPYVTSCPYLLTSTSLRIFGYRRYI